MVCVLCFSPAAAHQFLVKSNCQQEINHLIYLCVYLFIYKEENKPNCEAGIGICYFAEGHMDITLCTSFMGLSLSCCGDMSKCPDIGQVTQPQWIFIIPFLSRSIKKLLFHLNTRQSDLNLRKAFGRCKKCGPEVALPNAKGNC